jgi:hypothetical protein
MHERGRAQRPGEKDGTDYALAQVNIAYSPHTPTLASTHLDNISESTHYASIMLAACFKQAI